MSVSVEPTPNPRAMKFTVGKPVGGPATFTSTEDAPDGIREVLAIPGTTSVFMTADFITVSSDGSLDWDAVTANIVEWLEQAFG